MSSAGLNFGPTGPTADSKNDEVGPAETRANTGLVQPVQLVQPLLKFVESSPLVAPPLQKERPNPPNCKVVGPVGPVGPANRREQTRNSSDTGSRLDRLDRLDQNLDRLDPAGAPAASAAVRRRFAKLAQRITLALPSLPAAGWYTAAHLTASLALQPAQYGPVLRAWGWRQEQVRLDGRASSVWVRPGYASPKRSRGRPKSAPGQASPGAARPLSPCRALPESSATASTQETPDDTSHPEPFGS